MNKIKLSRQQKEILGWAYIISCKDDPSYFQYWEDKCIYLKPIRELIILNRRGHKTPARSESASISRSFRRLDRAGLIDRRYWHSFFLTAEGKKVGQDHATPAMWNRLSYLKDITPAIEIKG